MNNENKPDQNDSFRWEAPDFPFEEEMREIRMLGHKIEELLDKCGLNTCVIHKRRWKEDDSDEIHETWSIATCNAAEESAETDGEASGTVVGAAVGVGTPAAEYQTVRV